MNFSLNHIAAFLLGCFFLLACGNTDKEISALNNKVVGVEIAKSVKINYSIAGKKKAILSGPLMYRVQDSITYIEFPQSLHVEFFDAKDSLESTLDARYGKYKDSQSKVFLKDSVRVINVKGDTLYCDELYWDRDRTNVEFYTDKPVRIRTRTHIINGIGMEAKQDFKEWHIIQSTGFIKVANNEFPN